MKCGTTTLYHDLLSQPGIFLPDKESNLLFCPSPAEAYARAYKKMGAGQLCGEVCPDYSKLPDLDDAVPNAHALFPDSPPRIVYVVREPLSRTLSHHRFVSSRLDTRFPSMGPDINRCIRQHPELINYSRYAMQIRPWIEAFGEDHLLVIRFEDYIRDRRTSLAQILAFLGISTAPVFDKRPPLKNPSDSRPVLTPGWQRIIDSKLYRRLLRPLLGNSLRDWIRHQVLPKPAGNWVPPTPETSRYIIDQVRADTAELESLLGIDSPLWEPAAPGTLDAEA